MGSRLDSLRKNSSGFAALFGVITFSLLLVTISIASGRLAASELRQSAEVDRSDRALKAAEAGLEEALQRVDNDLNSDKTIAEIFNNSGASTANGDMAVLLDDDGNAPAALNIEADTGQDGGALAWRNRVVRQSSFDKLGVQVKDEIIEMDLSSLNELDENGEVCGVVGSSLGCGGNPLHPEVSGIRYCPTNIQPPTLPSLQPKYEFIVLSYGASNPTDIVSNRYVFDSFLSGLPANFSPDIEYGTQCLEYTIPSTQRTNRRFIFRIKPLFETGLIANPDLYSEYKVSYRAELLSDNPAVGEMVIADNSILIDVTGESGDVRRRIIAKKQRNGRLLGVFDYLLYSGDPAVPLCKAGVLYEVDSANGTSYNLNNCDDAVTTSVNQPAVIDGTVGTCNDPSAANSGELGPCQYNGCTDSTAINYDSDATINDGSCQPNIVQGDTVTNNSGSTPGYTHCTPSCLTDGNLNTMWYPGAWSMDVTIDLGSHYNLSILRFAWGSFGCSEMDACGNGHRYIDNYRLQGSADGSTFSTITTGGLPHATSTTWNGSTSAVRYLRFTVSSSANWFGVYELQASGASVSYAPSPPPNTVVQGESFSAGFGTYTDSQYLNNQAKQLYDIGWFADTTQQSFAYKTIPTGNFNKVCIRAHAGSGSNAYYKPLWFYYNGSWRNVTWFLTSSIQTYTYNISGSAGNHYVAVGTGDDTSSGYTNYLAFDAIEFTSGGCSI